MYTLHNYNCCIVYILLIIIIYNYAKDINLFQIYIIQLFCIILNYKSSVN